MSINRGDKLTYIKGSYKDSIAATASGQLVCMAHNSMWCSHVEEVIVKGMDWEEMFDRRTPSQVGVPMFPAEGIFAEVILTMGVSDSNLRAAISAPSDARPKHTVNLMSKSLGFINEGEGRRVIRNMVIAWMEPELRFDVDHRCIDPRHGKTESEMARRAFEEDRKLAIANIWCLMWYQKCLACFKKPAGFDPDLVPTDI